MTMLHIVNKSPFERNSFATCLKHAKAGSTILLIEDGVYAAIKGTAVTEQLKKAMANHAVYALWPDIEARGMQERSIEGIKLIDYSGFVDLTAEHSNVQSWL
ncbi:MAG: sulfurtransferase complex subunit TusB [Gammaproteobacteria bacterium]